MCIILHQAVFMGHKISAYCWQQQLGSHMQGDAVRFYDPDDPQTGFLRQVISNVQTPDSSP
jgi:hypothetical protein